MENRAEFLKAFAAAKTEVTQGINGDLMIKLGHLVGDVRTSDGVMYWSVYGIKAGEKRFDSTSGADKAAVAYGRAAVINEMQRIRASVLAKG